MEHMRKLAERFLWREESREKRADSSTASNGDLRYGTVWACGGPRRSETADGMGILRMGYYRVLRGSTGEVSGKRKLWERASFVFYTASFHLSCMRPLSRFKKYRSILFLRETLKPPCELSSHINL